MNVNVKLNLLEIPKNLQQIGSDHSTCAPFIKIALFIIEQDAGAGSASALRRSILYDVDFVPFNAGQVLCQPFTLHSGYCFVVSIGAGFAQPTNNAHRVTLGLRLVDVTSQQGQIYERLCFGVGSYILGDEVGQSAFYTVQVSDSSIKIKIDSVLHLSALPRFVEFIIAHF